jgi:hypothetical protein
MNRQIINTLHLGIATRWFNANGLIPVGDAPRAQNENYGKMIGAGLFQSCTIPYPVYVTTLKFLMAFDVQSLLDLPEL